MMLMVKLGVMLRTLARTSVTKGWKRRGLCQPPKQTKINITSTILPMIPFCFIPVI